MINPLPMGHPVLGLEGVWDNWLKETRALASWGSQLTVQKTPNCRSEKMINRDGDSWILIELLLLLSFSWSLPLREFSQTRPVGILSIPNKCANHRSGGAPDIFCIISA